MRTKKTFIIVILSLMLVLLTLAAVVAFSNKNAVQTTTGSKNNQIQTASGYEAAGGWMYTCSQPIQVRNQGATYGNGAPSPTPVDESEAQKYCQRGGIE